MYYTIKWNGDSVSMLDQKQLPGKEAYISYSNYSGVAEAITDMIIRGAPAIGIAAAMGIALGAKKITAKTLAEYKNELDHICAVFEKTRPTAVNLFWAINRMKEVAQNCSSVDEIKAALEREAIAIYDQDIEINQRIGKNGSRLLGDGDVVMTHCNAGALATGGHGTALGVIRTAIAEGKKIEVFACETRPYLQGARLTTWELLKDGIKVTLITDNMAGYFMRQGIIKKVIVGADRIALNGDTVNKIGTYSHSVLAKEHGIPFLVAAPISTLDPAVESGDKITIEERPVEEVACLQGVSIVPEGIFIRNPAFDVTPARNISAIITEKGVIEKPEQQGIRNIIKS